MATETIPQPQDQLSKPPPPAPAPAQQSDQHQPKDLIEPRNNEPEKTKITPWQSPRAGTPPDIIEKRKALKERLPSRKLSIDDFELLRTLGTGRSYLPPERCMMLTRRYKGTFARVWLVRLKNAPEKPNTVYALKVLRKADGMCVPEMT